MTWVLLSFPSHGIAAASDNETRSAAGRGRRRHKHRLRPLWTHDGRADAVPLHLHFAHHLLPTCVAAAAWESPTLCRRRRRREPWRREPWRRCAGLLLARHCVRRLRGRDRRGRVNSRPTILRRRRRRRRRRTGHRPHRRRRHAAHGPVARRRRQVIKDGRRIQGALDGCAVAVGLFDRVRARNRPAPHVAAAACVKGRVGRRLREDRYAQAGHSNAREGGEAHLGSCR